MANDTDMWNDIEALEREGRQEQADELLAVYNQRFVEGNVEEAEKLREAYRRKYGAKANYF